MLIDSLIHLLESLPATLNKLVDAVHGVSASIDHLTLQLKKQPQQDPNNMTPEIVKALIDALNALTALISTDNANVAAAQKAQKDAEDALQALHDTDAALQDPDLVKAANDALAAAQQANPGTGTGTTPPPAPAAFDPAATYNPGDQVTNPDGSVWTAVSPVVGEAPGTTSGNWTQNPSTAPTATAQAAKRRA